MLQCESKVINWIVDRIADRVTERVAHLLNETAFSSIGKEVLAHDIASRRRNNEIPEVAMK